MSDQPDNAPTNDAEIFEWHPDYAGRTFESVHRELVDRIHRDQKAYQAALESAEKEEFDAYNTVRDLEKRWSDYDFAWFELSPDELADKILQFEQERETRQELITWQTWKSASAPTVPPVSIDGEKGDWRENLTDHQRKRIASALSIIVIVSFVLLCVGLYYVIR